MRYKSNKDNSCCDSWKTWFAWYPVEARSRIPGQTVMVWLERVWYIRCFPGPGHVGKPCSYHTIDDGDVPGLDWDK